MGNTAVKVVAATSKSVYQGEEFLFVDGVVLLVVAELAAMTSN